MAEHTPGPYTTRDTRDSGTEITAEHFDGLVIATVYPRGSWHTAHSADQDTDPVQEANALLFVAAPTMAEYIRRLREINAELLAALTAQQCFDCRQWIEITPRRSPRQECETCAPAMAAMAKALGGNHVAS